MIAVLAAAAAAAAALTWAHLRPEGARGSLAFPSLQHVSGTAARSRRTFPLEERLAWALRSLALVAAVAGIWLSRSAASAGAVAVVDPALGDRGWREIPPEAALRLGFSGETVRAEGEGAARAAADLAGCSDTKPSCLLRAASATGRKLVIVSAFGPGWERALRRLGRPFQYLRVEASAGEPPAEPPAAEEPAPIRLTAESGAARLWAAALAAAAGTRVGDSPNPLVDVGGSLVVCDAPGPATPGHPALESAAPSGVVLPDPLDLAAGVAGLPLGSTLRFAPDPNFRPLIGNLAVQSQGAIAVAATAEELGRWAHEGMLLPLARALLAAALPEPVRLARAPPGGSLAWRPAVAVGVLDVAPRRYLRADGRVRLDLARPPLDATPAFDPQGSPWRAPPHVPSPATLLLLGALGLWLAAALPPRRKLLLPQLAALALLALLAADAARTQLVQPHREMSEAHAMVFDPRRPRVDLLEVRAPGELPFGAAAELRATLRVRRAAGQSVQLIARPASAAEAHAQLAIGSADEVREVRLPVTPLAAGVTLVAVEARLGEAEDARVVALSMRKESLRRLLLAASPSWESRAVAEALDALGETPAAQSTRLGAQAVLARGTRSPPALDSVDTLLLVGFADLPADVRGFLEAGGAAVLFGAPDAGTALPGTMAGRLDDGPELSFRGYPPSRDFTLPLGAEVMGRLGPRGAAQAPWMVGRAMGRGRLVVVTAPDLWRVSPPAGRGEAYRSLLAGALGWAEAARAGPAPVLQDDTVPDELLRVRRARLRAAAARQHQPFIEADGQDELASAWARVTDPAPMREPLKLRRDDLSFFALAALIALEGLLRRAH